MNLHRLENLRGFMYRPVNGLYMASIDATCMTISLVLLLPCDCILLKAKQSVCRQCSLKIPQLSSSSSLSALSWVRPLGAWSELYCCHVKSIILHPFHLNFPLSSVFINIIYYISCIKFLSVCLFMPVLFFALVFRFHRRGRFFSYSLKS
jgi:hypothetical protein